MPFSPIGLYGRRKFYKATYKLINNIFFEYGQEKLKLTIENIMVQNLREWMNPPTYVFV
jgi:hypothetical protein